MASRPTRRPRLCPRGPNDPPGSCWYWWESCPDNVANCGVRAARARVAAQSEHARAMNALILTQLDPAHD